MDKLKLAHDYAMKHLEGKFYTESEQWRVAQAWDYADLMYAEQEKRTDKTRPDVLDEFQVDWSQAPGWANWWAMDGFSKKANWYIDKPYIDDDSEVESEWNIDLKTDTETYMCAPSFNYQGDWKSSLQERK